MNNCHCREYDDDGGEDVDNDNYRVTITTIAISMVMLDAMMVWMMLMVLNQDHDSEENRVTVVISKAAISARLIVKAALATMADDSESEQHASAVSDDNRSCHDSMIRW